MDIKKEREAFEKYCFEVFLMSPSDGHFDRELQDPEFYESVDTHRLWKLWQDKAQADQKVKLLLCDEHLKKCESPTGIFNSQYPDEEPCLICLAKEAKAQAGPEWISVEDSLPKKNANVLLNVVARRRGKPFSCIGFYSVEPDDEPCFILDDNFTILKGVTHWMQLPQAPKAQEPAND